MTHLVILSTLYLVYKLINVEDFLRLKKLTDFICKEYKYIAYLFDGLQIVKYAVPELKDIHAGPQIVSTFRKHYRKRFFPIYYLFYFVFTFDYGNKVYSVSNIKNKKNFLGCDTSCHTLRVIIFIENLRRTV